jgi:hypothetical protein
LPDTRPTVASWQLAIRFALEVGALVAVGACAGDQVPHLATLARWGVPALLVLLWVTFAVRDDPSRSGKAPVPVPGAVRLALELLVFGAGAAALAVERRWSLFGAFLVLLVVHHAGTLPRLRWLLRQ